MPDYRLARLAYIIQFGEGVLAETSTRFDSLFTISTLVKTTYFTVSVSNSRRFPTSCE